MSIYRDKIIESAARELREGADVRTADGHRLGEIVAIDGAFAKIARPLRRDIWLRAEYLLADGDAFTTSFQRSDLGAYQLDAPAADPLEETADAASIGAILSDEEQEQQRIQMEAELAAQRRELPHAHAAGEASPPDTGGTIGEPVEEELARIAPEALAGLYPSQRSVWMRRGLLVAIPVVLVALLLGWRRFAR